MDFIFSVGFGISDGWTSTPRFLSCDNLQQTLLENQTSCICQEWAIILKFFTNCTKNCCQAWKMSVNLFHTF